MAENKAKEEKKEKKIVIENTKRALVQVPASNKNINARKGKKGFVNLAPGMNIVDENTWKIIRPRCERFIDTGRLVEVNVSNVQKVKKEKNMVVSSMDVDNILEMEVKKAIKIIRKMNNLDSLNDLYKVEKRESVYKVLYERIQFLEKPPEEKK